MWTIVVYVGPESDWLPAYALETRGTHAPFIVRNAEGAVRVFPNLRAIQRYAEEQVVPVVAYDLSLHAKLTN
jgi:hypothetical protein